MGNSVTFHFQKIAEELLQASLNLELGTSYQALAGCLHGSALGVSSAKLASQIAYICLAKSIPHTLWFPAASSLILAEAVPTIRSYEQQQAAVHKYVVNKESLSSICSDRMYMLVYFRVESESLYMWQSVELLVLSLSIQQRARERPLYRASERT